jgi:hypothetical protein
LSGVERVEWAELRPNGAKPSDPNVSGSKCVQTEQHAKVQAMIKSMCRKAGKVVIDWKKIGDTRGSLDDARREGSKMKHNSQVCRH